MVATPASFHCFAGAAGIGVTGIGIGIDSRFGPASCAASLPASPTPPAPWSEP